MPLTITKHSLKLLNRLLENEFHSIPQEFRYIDRIFQLLHTGNELGLNNTVDELINCLMYNEWREDIRNQINDLKNLKSA